jgi:hypothetical protein
MSTGTEKRVSVVAVPGLLLYSTNPWIIVLGVAAEVILTHCAEVEVTHLGKDDGLFGAVDVDPGAGSGDTSDGPKGRGGQSDCEAAGLLAQHGTAIPA